MSGTGLLEQLAEIRAREAVVAAQEAERSATSRAEQVADYRALVARVAFGRTGKTDTPERVLALLAALGLTDADLEADVQALRRDAAGAPEAGERLARGAARAADADAAERALKPCLWKVTDKVSLANAAVVARAQMETAGPGAAPRASGWAPRGGDRAPGAAGGAGGPLAARLWGLVSEVPARLTFGDKLASGEGRRLALLVLAPLLSEEERAELARLGQETEREREALGAAWTRAAKTAGQGEAFWYRRERGVTR